MMSVRYVRVIVNQGHVSMWVGMRLARRVPLGVFMLMVLVMHMEVFMLEGPVLVNV